MENILTNDESISETEKIITVLEIIDFLNLCKDEKKKEFFRDLFTKEGIKELFINECINILEYNQIGVVDENERISEAASVFANQVKNIIKIATETPVSQNHSDFVNALAKKEVEANTPKILNTEKFYQNKNDNSAIKSNGKKPNGSELQVKAKNKNKTLSGGQSTYQKLV